MTARTPVEALAHAIGDLVAVGDVAHVLASVLDDAVEALAADAIGLMVRTSDDELELLTSTSHRIDELEIYQAQQGSGPCVEAIRDRVQVSATGAGDIMRRWPDVGRAIIAAGFTNVHAFPLRWDDEVFGAINVFHRAEPQVAELALIGQAFADIISSIVVRPSDVQREALVARVTGALSSRTVVEQAKGVLSYQEGITMDAAYDRLRELARLADRELSEVAHGVVTDASRPRTSG